LLILELKKLLFWRGVKRYDKNKLRGISEEPSHMKMTTMMMTFEAHALKDNRNPRNVKGIARLLSLLVLKLGEDQDLEEEDQDLEEEGLDQEEEGQDHEEEGHDLEEEGQDQEEEGQDQVRMGLKVEGVFLPCLTPLVCPTTIRV
jgi:hypothetical protein